MTLHRAATAIADPRHPVLNRSFRGIISAPFMPMVGDGRIDWDSLRHYIRWVAGQKPAVIAVNMDAAEAPALTASERVEVMHVCGEVVGDHIPLISGLIGGSTDQMITHGRDLLAAGAQGFCIFPPFPVFMGAPIQPEMIRRFHGDLAEALDVPLIAFQFPRGWGPDYSGEMLDALASVPQVIAIKESSFDANQTIQTVQAVGALSNRIAVLTGSDTFIYEALLMGCDGALIGFAGTAITELVAMQHAIDAGDAQLGREIWERLAPLARFCWRAPIRDFRPRMKEVLRLQGLIASSAVRRPQLDITGAEKAELKRIAHASGLI